MYVVIHLSELNIDQLDHLDLRSQELEMTAKGKFAPTVLYYFLFRSHAVFKSLLCHPQTLSIRL